VKACFNCGLETVSGLGLCAGCGADLSDVEQSGAQTVSSASPAQGDNSSSGSPSLRRKSLNIRILEWCLVLFALSQSGVVYLGYWLYRTRGSLPPAYSWEGSEWMHYIWRNVCPLGILGYVLFRNSKWCPSHGSHPPDRDNAVPRPARSQVTKLRIVELALVLMVAFGGSILRSFEVLLGYETLPSEPVKSRVVWLVYGILSNGAALGLLRYVLDRSSRTFRELGLHWTSRDVAVALPLALGAGLASRLLHPITFAVAEMQGGHRTPVADISKYLFGSSVTMAAVLGAIVVGFFEELIVRGYLMTEVKRLTGSMAVALICSVAVQVSYHFYQGGPEALALAGGFLAFAGYYAKTNRLLPPVLAHIALDLDSLIMYALRAT